MRWLHEELAEMGTFCKNFQDEYMKDMDGIYKYAGAEILETLWVRKATARAAPQDDSQDKKIEKWEEKFADKRRSLHEAIEAALNAGLSSGDQETPKATTLESRRHLQQKVETSSYQVIDLLNRIMEKSEHCKALLVELKTLKELVDPQKKGNQELYGGGDAGLSGSDEDGDYGSNNNQNGDWES